jgi:hypothetical protein
MTDTIDDMAAEPVEQVPAAPAIDEESVAEQLVAQTREKGIGAGRPERVAQQSHQAGVGGRAGGGDVVGVAEDAGFEPARACTQPAFQVCPRPSVNVHSTPRGGDYRHGNPA